MASPPLQRHGTLRFPPLRCIVLHIRSTSPLVLCYHAVSADWPAELASRPEQLEAHVRYLLRRGYRPLTFTDAVTAGAADKAFAVTFDDAYASIDALARPLLASLDVPATVFAPTDYIGRDEPMSWPGIDQWVGGAHRDELLPMSWEQLRDLAEHGWEIGSHTCSHPRLTQLAPAALDEELSRSRAVCEERLGRPCTSLAYPYGDVDDRVVAAARRAGYRVAAALPGGGTRPVGPLEVPRVGVYLPDDLWRFRLKVSPVTPHLRRLHRAVRVTARGRRSWRG